jgi:hypothetical protein
MDVSSENLESAGQKKGNKPFSQLSEERISSDSSYSKNRTWQSVVSGEVSLDKLVSLAESEYNLGLAEARIKVLQMLEIWSKIELCDISVMDNIEKSKRTRETFFDLNTSSTLLQSPSRLTRDFLKNKSKKFCSLCQNFYGKKMKEHKFVIVGINIQNASSLENHLKSKKNAKKNFVQRKIINM